MSLPTTMRAVRLEAWGQTPVLRELPVPEPGPGQVLVRVEAAGLCRSDLHVMDAPAGRLPYRLPFTLGHEIAGTVAALGAGVDAGWQEASVVVHGIWSCGQCRNCVRGRDNYCLELTGGPLGAGLGRDGGLADYVLVPDVRHLVRNPGLRPVAAAPLTDGGLTALHAVTEHLHLVRGGSTLLIGAGGLGHLALQVLVAVPDSLVVVVDTSEAARTLAVGLGAAGVASTVPDGVELLRRLGRGPGADLVVDFVGSPETLSAVPAALAPGGALALVGSAGGRVDAAKGEGLPPGWRITAPLWGPHSDLERIVQLAHEGGAEPETTVVPLTGTLAAYRQLRDGAVAGRTVVVP